MNLNLAEQWVVIAALAQAILITVIIILIKTEEKRLHRSSQR